MTLDLAGQLCAHIESAARWGTSPEGQVRAGRLFLTIAEGKISAAAASAEFARVKDQCSALEGKAVTPTEKAAVLDLRTAILEIQLENAMQCALRPD